MKTEKRMANRGERVVALNDCIFGDFREGDEGTVMEYGGLRKSTVYVQIDGKPYDFEGYEGAVMLLDDYEVIVEDD